jgi:hypothetical protein
MGCSTISSDNVPEWINKKVITCANTQWPVVMVEGSIKGNRVVGKPSVGIVGVPASFPPPAPAKTIHSSSSAFPVHFL